MAADRLDEQTEARIREACVNLRGGSDSDRSGDEWHNPEPYDFDAPNATCLCRDLRAAIRADREAREKHADTLAEALRDAANEMHSYGLVADHWLHGKQVTLTECGYAPCVAANEILAAHDKLRGAEVRRG